MMLPMVFVNCLLIPISDAITMPFAQAVDEGGSRGRAALHPHRSLLGSVDHGDERRRRLPFRRAGHADDLGSEDPRQIADGAMLLRLFTPIVLLSAWTVVGKCGAQRASQVQGFGPGAARCSGLFHSGDPPLAARTPAGLRNPWDGCRHPRQCVDRRPPLPPPGSRSAAVTGRMFGFHPTDFWHLRLAGFCRAFHGGRLSGQLLLCGMSGEGGVSGWALSSKMILLFNGLVVTAVHGGALPTWPGQLREAPGRRRGAILFSCCLEEHGADWCCSEWRDSGSRRSPLSWEVRR